MKNALGQLVGTYNHRIAPMGAGGFVTGAAISSDGQRLVHWTDVFNGYVRNIGDPIWKQAFRTDTLQTVEYDPLPVNPTEGGRAMYAMAIAPSNKDVIYADFNGYLYKSTNGGAAFTRTAATQKVTLPGSGDARHFNHTLSVHPTDPNIVIRGTNGSGTEYSTNGGTSWTAVSGLPATTLAKQGADARTNIFGKCLTAFDPTLPATVYIHVFGTGLYRSTTGVTGTFSFVSGGPARAAELFVTAAGKVYICEYPTTETPLADALKSMTRAGVWSFVAGSVGAKSAAVNPNNANHIVWLNPNGGYSQTRDNGATMTNNATYRGNGEVKWFSNRSKPMSTAMVMFDPVVNNQIWITEGLGICYAQCPATTEALTVFDYSNGNEELIVTSIMKKPGNPVPIITSWDKPLWRIEDTRKPTNIFSYPPNTPSGSVFPEQGVTIGHAVDWAIDDANFLATTVGQGEVRVGYSNDFGKTFTAYTGAPAGGWVGSGGWVAVSNKANIIHTFANSGGAYYTLNGGTSWTPITIGSETPPLEFSLATFVTRQNITADKTRAGAFAILINNIIPQGLPDAGNQGRANAGVWVTTNGGVSFTQKFAGVIHGNPAFPNGRDQRQFWQAKIAYVPGLSQNLMYADMVQDNGKNPLMWSQDDGATWTNVRSTVRNLQWFGFGKAKEGQARPAVFFVGYVNDILGHYVSFDWFATDPELITRFPNNIIAAGNIIEGDMDTFGRHYVGIGGNGALVVDYGKNFTLV